MNSQCTLLYVVPAGGGSEENYVTKRATVNDDLATKDTAEQEYRFYSDWIYPPPGEAQPPKGDPVMMLGAIQVPRCLIVNWRLAKDAEDIDKQEEEEEIDDDGAPKKKISKQVRNQYFLLLERLDAPDWESPPPAAGLTHRQSIAGSIALARMHNSFDDPAIMKKLEWLPLTVFNLKKAADAQEDFGTKIELERSFVQQILTWGAFEATMKMVSGGLTQVCEKLAEPPLTFCHGDYRPENLRFTTKEKEPDLPTVATFDFGLSCRARHSYDVAYYLILCQPPHVRRSREMEQCHAYLKERLHKDPTDEEIGVLYEELKWGCLAILALVLMTRIAARAGGFYAETRETQSRMVRWVGTAVQDWGAWDVFYTDEEKAKMLAEQQQ